MGYYPVLLQLTGRPCVVIGGGAAAEDKVSGLLDVGARVTVVAPRVTPGLAARIEREEAAATTGPASLQWRSREVVPGDLAGAFLVISTLQKPAVNAGVWAEAEALGVPCNVMDDVPRCSFIAGSVLRRGRLIVTVSTSGAAPAFAVRLRQRLERHLGDEVAAFLELAAATRAPLMATFPEFAERRDRWYRLVDSDVLSLLRRGDEAAARRRWSEIMGVDPEPVHHAAENGEILSGEVEPAGQPPGFEDDGARVAAGSGSA